MTHFKYTFTFPEVKYPFNSASLKIEVIKEKQHIIYSFSLVFPTPIFHTQVFNQAAFQAQSDRELTDAVEDFTDCCIVIPPTEIPNESMLASLIPFQKRLLQERLRPSDPKLRLEVKPRKRKETYTKYSP